LKKSKGMRKHIRNTKAKRRKALEVLDPTERKVVDLIIMNISKVHRPPTLREIAAKLKWHHTYAAQVIDKLVGKKYLKKDKDASRGIRLNPDFYEVVVNEKS